MIKFFAKHPTAANLLMVMFLLAGILSLPSIKRETFPEVKSFEVEVRVAYPGAAPSDVETGICKPLEDALDGISFIEEKRCQARTSLGIMTIKMFESGNFTQFLDDVNSAVDGIDNFPGDAEVPTIKELGRTQEVITVALTADLTRPELKRLAEETKQRMLQFSGIPLVEIQGFSNRQFQVQISQHKLRELGLSLQDISQVISSQDVDLPVGDVKTPLRDYQIRLSDERRSVDELSSLVVLRGDQGNEVRLGDIANIVPDFEVQAQRAELNGQAAAFLKIKKNTIDDSLRVLNRVKQFIQEEESRLPDGVSFYLTQDYTSVVSGRISLLGSNALQGLILVFLVMWLFFGSRYAFWVVMGLPVSFLASAFVLGNMGITINMLSMVALLLALGILMDDAIVISESIATQLRLGKKPLEAAVDGARKVANGVFSSFLTTVSIFVGLLFLKGDIGQVLRVIPIVLISVIVVSLIEAFFILPNHLYHALEKGKDNVMHPFRKGFEDWFENLRLGMDRWVGQLIRYRYLFVGSVMGLFVLSVGMLASGIVKFAAFPDLEGDIVQARILMPAGTSNEKTQSVVDDVLLALRSTEKGVMTEHEMSEALPLIKSVTVNYNENSDAFETGAHLATLTVDMLESEERPIKMNQFITQWREKIGIVPSAQSISIKEPAIGPAGRAIYIRLLGEDLDELSEASYALQNWLSGYPGVTNLMDDLRPGKPEFTLQLKPGAFALGLDSKVIASQMRAAYQGSKVLETNVGLETIEVSVILAESSRDSLADFDNFPVIHPNTGKVIPLSTVADITMTRSVSRIHRINNQRAVTLYGDVDTDLNNTAAVIKDFQNNYLPTLRKDFPNVTIELQGEAKNSKVTQDSMQRAFILGLFVIFILLSVQFHSYIEPLIVIVNIPLALIGVIWGHLIMGLDITMPSMLGFVSLAGIVVNDSILLVIFAKNRVAEGMTVHDAAAKASHDRFRAVVLTSLTTIAGMTPLLFETSLHAQILIPLTTSIVFGIGSSTFLVLFVVPCLYAILEDFGVVSTHHLEEDLDAEAM
ncbi:acriflavin resistance protein [Gammaproteobacteria bacterium 45_16_T64]|nr:acriflavin resistance protein [Gammaproteobacteria bacterium 45_16_T64]